MPYLSPSKKMKRFSLFITFYFTLPRQLFTFPTAKMEDSFDFVSQALPVSMEEAQPAKEKQAEIGGPSKRARREDGSDANVAHNHMG
ncbi:hypothetical protein ACOSP7_019431 [Xanthoceras sorbifolium]